MRRKINTDTELDFQPPRLKVTQTYCERYEQISKVLSAHPELVDRLHEDLAEALKATRARRGKRYKYSSDTVLRIQICQLVEGLSLRETIVRIDTSEFLRRFVRLYSGPMMDYTTFCKLRNAVRPETWKSVNQLLAKAAVREGHLCSDQLRLDTTAVETNIHWPTDSSLLWDAYRTLARLIEETRETDREAVGNRRLHQRRVKRLAQRIGRKAAKRSASRESLKPLYERLIGSVEAILEWSTEVVSCLRKGIENRRYDLLERAMAGWLVQEIRHYAGLTRWAVQQARRRVLEGERVPNDEKLFSLFEDHTELLKRGKAGKDIEFGHMIQIQQVQEKFITDYEVFPRRPIEHQLVLPALESHRRLFGTYPECLAADKGYYESMAVLRQLEKKVETVSIAKKGGRTTEERERETDPFFRLGQRFRAGVEGTISFLKRVLRLARCFNKGFEHFVSTVGATIFVHNLIVLSRH